MTSSVNNQNGLSPKKLVCYDASIINSKKHPSLMLSLRDEKGCTKYRYFVPIECRPKSKKHTAPKNSKLKKLYRLTFGCEPNHAYVENFKGA